MSQLPNEPKKLDPMEVFQVLGASDDIDSDALQQKSKEVGASPEVVAFMETLPENVHEPADVVAAAADAGNNPVGAELDMPETPSSPPELTIDEITGPAEPK
jgi:hypothetical protein